MTTANIWGIQNKGYFGKPSTVINLCLIVKCHLGQTVVLYAIDMF